MDWKERIRTALAATGGVPDEDVVEELAQHAAATYEAARSEGCDDEEAIDRVDEHVAIWRRDAPALSRRARRAAAVEPPAVRSSIIGGIVDDARYGVRLLCRKPGYGALVVLTMALGIAATTVLFGVVYGVLLKPLPWKDADRVVQLSETRGGRTPRFGGESMTNVTYHTWRQQMTTVEDLGAASAEMVTLTGVGEPERLRICETSASLLRLLGARPVLGSLYGEADEAPGAEKVAVLSHGLWQERFGASEGVLGRVVRMDDLPYRIVAVLERDFWFPDRETRLYVPLRVAPITGNSMSLFTAFAKLKPGATPGQAAAEGTARGAHVPDTGMTVMAMFGGTGPVGISAVRMADAMTADVRPALLLLLAAVGLLLLTATANVASLQLARNTTRRREIAIRAAIGAGVPRLTRQLLVENVILSLAGGVVGVTITAWVLRILPSVMPADFPRLGDVGVSFPVLAFAAAASFAAGLLVGVMPAVQASRTDLVTALSADGRAPSGGGVRAGAVRTRLLIMSGQVAIACVLLVGASLLLQSFVSLLNADRGFNTADVLTARVQMPDSRYTPARRAGMMTAMLERLRAVPGVQSVGFTTQLPLTQGGGSSAFNMPSRSADGGMVFVQASTPVVSAGYLAAIGVRALAGRLFSEADTATSAPVVVVNRMFAQRYLGGTRSALGERLPGGLLGEGKPPCEVIGVVEDVRRNTATEQPQPEIYISYVHAPNRLNSRAVHLVVRGSRDPAALIPVVRSIAREQDASVVVDSVLTLQERLVRSLAKPRLYAAVLVAFAAFAVTIVAVGLFGVLSYSIAQRSREIAVRTALGARPLQVTRLVLRQGLLVAAAGVAAGVCLSLALTRFLSTFLYGVTATDPLTFVLVPLALLCVSTVACLVPARRAARLDPLTVLRDGA